MKRPGCNAAVTVVHTGVKNLADYVRQGDVVVAAAGSAGLVTSDMIKPGAAVVAAVRIAKEPAMEGRMIVTILPDSGERYLTSVLFDGVGD